MGVCLDEDNVVLEDGQERSCCSELHISPSYMENLLLGGGGGLGGRRRNCIINDKQQTLQVIN